MSSDPDITLRNPCTYIKTPVSDRNSAGLHNSRSFVENYTCFIHFFHFLSNLFIFYQYFQQIDDVQALKKVAIIVVQFNSGKDIFFLKDEAMTSS